MKIVFQFKLNFLSNDGLKCGWRTLTRYTADAVSQDENHAAQGPSNAENAHSGAIIKICLALVTYDSGNSDIQEQECGHELSNQSSVEGPF